MKKIFKAIKAIIKPDEVFIIDFTDFGIWGTEIVEDNSLPINPKTGKLKKKIPIQPIDIIHEIEASIEFPEIELKSAIKNLKKLIKFMKKTLKQDYTKDEERALAMLEARVKYPKYSKFFAWKTTTKEHIKKLITKYDLEHGDVKNYVRKIPELAITSMEKYNDIYKKITKDPPKFSLIAPPKYFKDKKSRTDPILLARSPFGDYYYILAAWDKEISMVSELLDNEKLVIDKNGKGKIKGEKNRR